MIDPKDFTNILIQNNLKPVVQVPCSYFKNLLNYLIDTKAIEVVNPVNEGLAMGIAVGKYLSTGTIPIVMIQNSGLLNTLNALTSLNQIYEIPVLYIITWRGEGGVGADAPEHDIVGENLEKILTSFQIQYEIINEEIYQDQIENLVNKAQETKLPVALIIKKDTFANYQIQEVTNGYEMDRFEVIQILKEEFSSTSLFISSTGFPSRDSFSVKDSEDFYIMGSMGHTFSIGLGLSENIKKRIVILDGDASSLMHVGGLASFDDDKHKNLLYVVLDNEVCESTGCQPTVSKKVSYQHLAKAFKFNNFYSVTTKKDLRKTIAQIQRKTNESIFLHVKINYNTSRKSERVSKKYTAPQIKTRFMKNIG